MTNTTNTTTADAGRTERLERAEIIRQQIGHRAMVMIGAREMVATERGLQFRVGANAKKVTHIVVELAADDTYTMTFSARRGGRYAVRAVVDGVYCDGLNQVIQAETGLYTSL